MELKPRMSIEMNRLVFLLPSFCRSLVLICAMATMMATAGAQTPTVRGKAAPAGVERQQFPPDHPAFCFDLPSTWTVDRGNEDKSMLICNLKGRGDIGLLCMSMPNIFSLDDMVQLLPGLAQEQLERQGILDLQIISQGKNQVNGADCFFVITKGKLRNQTMSVTLVGLVSLQRRGYLLEYALPSSDGPAHIKEFQTIMDSLKPVQ
ncbi:MAG: hypothetical protein INR62_00825 [Rhodospirillales bacterium]|nr:hypothetical protein [Acetobacter sp.]